MTNLPPRWAVKNDGSELFKNTVVKYCNDIFNAGWNWEMINSWYWICDWVPIVECAINMENIMAIDLDDFVEEYLPNTINDLSEGWIIRWNLFDNQWMELINKYYRTFGYLWLYSRLDDSYYWFATKTTNSILYYSNTAEILNSPYHFTMIQDFETIRPLLEKALSTPKSLPNIWSVKYEDWEESNLRFLKVLNFIKEQTWSAYVGVVGKHYWMSNGDSFYSDYPNTNNLSLDIFLKLIWYESPTTTTSAQEEPTFTAPAQEVDAPIVQTIKELPPKWAIKWEGRDNANDYEEVIAYINFKTWKDYTWSAHSKYYWICWGTWFCLANPDTMLEIQKISIADVINYITTVEVTPEITDQEVPTKKELPTNWAVKANINDLLFPAVMSYINDTCGTHLKWNCYWSYYWMKAGEYYCQPYMATHVTELTSREAMDIIESMNTPTTISVPIEKRNIEFARGDNIEIIQINWNFYYKIAVLDAIKDLKIISVDLDLF